MLAAQIDQDDRTLVKLTESSRETLLFESRQFHPQWIARGAGKRLETVLVNDIWLGVRLPPNTREVELVFEPWTRWMWVVHVALALGGIVAATVSIRSSHRRRA